MSRSAAISIPSAPAPAAAARGRRGPLASLLRAIRRERSRRLIESLDEHLRRDVGLMPREAPKRLVDPYDPRRFIRH